MKMTFLKKIIVCGAPFILGAVFPIFAASDSTPSKASANSEKVGDTKTGAEGYDALYGKKTSDKEMLPDKWIPRFPPNSHPDAQWFRTAALGLFQHWGIVSGSPKGEAWDMRIYTQKTVSEEELLKNKISPEKMFERVNEFNPTNYQPDHWMSAASAAGFRYAVLTTRHHDSYFLGKSKFGDWHAGHYLNRDLISPWVDACRKNHIKVGFYFSGPDWYHGREYQCFSFPENKPPFYNWKHEKVDSLQPMPPAVRQERDEIAIGQVREVLTNYGKIDLFWPDGGSGGMTLDEARKLQPGMIWGRIGEYATPEGWEMMKMEYIKEANRRGYPWEFCTIGNGGSWHWSQKAEDHGISAESLISQLAQVRARGGVLLLNIAPRPDGEMPHWFYPLCDELAAWMKTGAEAIYEINTEGPFPYPDQCDRPVTTTDKAWYVFPDAKPNTFSNPIEIRDVEKPKQVTLLRNGEPVQFDYADRKLTLHLAKEQRTALPDVVKIAWAK